MARYVQRFSVVPKELFRTNYGPVIHLRDRAVKLTGSYDLQTEGGKVKPKALNPDTYRGRRDLRAWNSLLFNWEPQLRMGRQCVPIPPLSKNLLSV